MLKQTEHVLIFSHGVFKKIPILNIQLNASKKALVCSKT